MSNYSIEQLVSICYDPGIPTDLDIGNISVPELTLRANFVDSLEFSTFTIGFTVEQLSKKRNGDTFIDELNFMGSPVPPNPYEAGIEKITIKFFYTPLEKKIAWKYDQSEGLSFDYTGIRFIVSEINTRGKSTEMFNNVLYAMSYLSST